jgi:hypothetical protein
MRYRIEVSQTRKGFGQVHFPGRIIALEAVENLGRFWDVTVSDGGDPAGSVSVRADSAADAVWRAAQAVVRAVAELTQSPIDGDVGIGPHDALPNDALTNVP